MAQRLADAQIRELGRDLVFGSRFKKDLPACRRGNSLKNLGQVRRFNARFDAVLLRMPNQSALGNNKDTNSQA
jgi:hypothetical protein